MKLGDNMEDDFAKQWQEAFENAEEVPALGVWNGIDRALTYMDLGKERSRVLFYKWTAAASILLASLGFSWYLMNPNNSGTNIYSEVSATESTAGDVSSINTVTDQTLVETLTEEPLAEKPAVDHPMGGSFRSGSSQSGNSRSGNSLNEGALNGHNTLVENSEAVPVHGMEARTTPVFVLDQERELKREKISLLTLQRINPPIESTTSLSHSMYRVPSILDRKRTRMNTSQDRFWAGVDVGTGTFNPNYQESASGSIALLSDQDFRTAGFNQSSAPDVNEDMQSGFSQALGLNFGLNLSPKWTLESGVRYTRSQSMTSTNVVVATNQFQKQIPITSETQNLPEVNELFNSQDVINYDYADIELVNQFQFASIPIKAGYYLVDRKFSLKVNAGVSTNFYLGNRLSDPDQNFAAMSVGPGANSPYREVSFTGLTGLQLGYELWGHFDIILEPSYNQSLNSLTKGSTSFTANPSGLGVFTGIRYNFH